MCKALVYGLLVLEAAQSIIIGKDMFTSFVINYGDLKALAEVRLVWLTNPVMTGIGWYACYTATAQTLN